MPFDTDVLFPHNVRITETLVVGKPLEAFIPKKQDNTILPPQYTSHYVLLLTTPRKATYRGENAKNTICTFCFFVSPPADGYN